MISMNLHQAAAMTGGTLAGKPAQFHGVSTDSRVDNTGRIFIALKGDNFNGENYCQQAIDNGAIAVIVSAAQDVLCPQLICKDPLMALSTLAKNWAKQCQAKIIAITGSNGKTTVKNMVQSIFSITNKCTATKGNLNNQIGVPLTLCNINQDDQYAIIEMGASKLGDITWLVSLVDIHTAVITSVSSAHIGGFLSFENIVSEKGQILSTLDKNDYAVLPIDDDHYALWKEKTISNILSFGNNPQADITTESIKHINLPVAGKHNQTNAACAVAIAQSCNISLDDIKTGLTKFSPESGRLENMGMLNGNTIINDSYNANPQSVKAAIDVLADISQPTTLVLGDMAELGDDSLKLHQEIGEYAKNNNITYLLTVGKDSHKASQAFSNKPSHFKHIRDLQSQLLENWELYGTILVKGSRSMHLEDLVENLMNSEKVA
jgi:UDP-N-acetylmuramoyl-tripeptide--D-alanyl-D-alanine ligase